MNNSSGLDKPDSDEDVFAAKLEDIFGKSDFLGEDEKNLKTSDDDDYDPSEETVLMDEDETQAEIILEKQIKSLIKQIGQLKTSSKIEKKKKREALAKTALGNIEAGADFVLDMKKREVLSKETKQLPAPNPYFKLTRAALLRKIMNFQLIEAPRAISEFKEQVAQSQEHDPEFKTTESEKIKTRISQLKQELANISRTEDIRQRIAKLDPDDILETEKARLEIRDEGKSHVRIVLHPQDISDAPRKIKAPKEKDEQLEIKKTKELERLEAALKIALKAENLCGQIQNLKAGNIIVSNRGTERKVLKVNQDEITVLRKEKRHSMKISKIIDWQLNTVREIISGARKDVGELLEKTQTL